MQVGNHHKEQKYKGTGDNSLEEDGARGSAIAIESGYTFRDALIDTGHHEEAGEDVVVDDCRDDKRSEDTESCDISSYVPKSCIHRTDHREKHVGRVLTLDNQDGISDQ